MSVSPTLTVSSPDFPAGGNIPSMFSCVGAGLNPALHVAAVPTGCKTLALIVHDPDAPHPGGYTHWVVWNIEPSLVDIPRDFKGAVQGTNSGGRTGYTGPCPPSGVHHYHFIVYALDVKLAIDPKSDQASLEKAMRGHILAQGEVIGLFAKK